MEPDKSAGRIKGVIYDCDGVLFDSLEVNRKFYNQFCTNFGRPPLTEEELKYAHTHTTHEALRFLFPQNPDLERQALALLSTLDPRETIGYLELEPNLLPALNQLKEKGIFRAVNTNRSTSMKYIMERFHLEAYFDLVVTSLDVQNPKPHPESIEKILKTLGLKPEETVFVGDSEIDRRAARSAGVKFISYKNQEIPADAFIDDHLALLNYI